MELRSRTERLDPDRAEDMTRAAALLLHGGTVAFPTETVYGLGANALDASAVEKIFIAKQRPHWDPLICHISEPGMLDMIAEIGSRTARQLMDRFWPGPLTLLLPRNSNVPDLVTAGRPLVGVRMPSHPVALALIRRLGVPVAAPSANTFGHISPTTAAHVLADLDGRIDAVLDGGPTKVGLESTVVEVVGGEVVVYRPGGITPEMLAAATAFPVRFHGTGPAEDPAVGNPSPGMDLRHYAPRARLRLIATRAPLESHLLLDAAREELNQGVRVGVLLPDGWGLPPGCSFYPWGAWEEREVLAQRLYSGLRALDSKPVDIILCPVPEGVGIAEAVRDRLSKAARRV